jgi:transcriptional regulator with XRE-family HTH domain
MVESFTASQMRAARALLGWTQHDLARASGIGRRTIADIESGARDPLTSTLRTLVGVFTLAGIRFVDDGDRDHDGDRSGRGVRWRRVGVDGPHPDDLKMFKFFNDGLKQWDEERQRETKAQDKPDEDDRKP